MTTERGKDNLKNRREGRMLTFGKILRDKGRELISYAEEIYGTEPISDETHTTGSIFIRKTGRKPGQRHIDVSHPIHPSQKFIGNSLFVIDEHSVKSRDKHNPELSALRDVFIDRELGRIIHSALFAWDGVTVEMRQAYEPLPYEFGVGVATCLLARHKQLLEVNIDVQPGLPEFELLTNRVVRRNSPGLPGGPAQAMPPGLPPLPYQ